MVGDIPMLLGGVKPPDTAPVDEKCRLRFVEDDPLDARIDQAISVGYALSGGQNAALVIRGYKE